MNRSIDRLRRAFRGPNLVNCESSPLSIRRRRLFTSVVVRIAHSQYDMSTTTSPIQRHANIWVIHSGIATPRIAAHRPL